VDEEAGGVARVAEEIPMPTRAQSFSHRRRWGIAEGRAALAAMAASGLSPDAFARREGLQVQRLRRWRERLGGGSVAKAATAAFVEVGRHAATERVEIVLRSGRMLRVPDSIDAVMLRRIVDVLEHDASC
jgi:hypothetical protein